MNNKVYYDISPIVSNFSPVFPDDVKFKRFINADFLNQNYRLSSIQTTLHIGSHIDAPSHYSKNGISIDICPIYGFH